MVMTCGVAARMTSARIATASSGDDEEKRKASRAGYFLPSSTLRTFVRLPWINRERGVVS